jgi:hypothetical protein
MDARSRRVNSTHAWRGRWSRRSEINSSAEVRQWEGTTSLGVEVLVGAVLTLVAAFLLALAVARLVAAVGLDSGFLGLAVSLVAH